MDNSYMVVRAEFYPSGGICPICFTDIKDGWKTYYISSVTQHGYDRDFQDFICLVDDDKYRLTYRYLNAQWTIEKVDD